MARLGRVKGMDLRHLDVLVAGRHRWAKKLFSLQNGDRWVKHLGEVAAERKLTGPSPRQKTSPAWFANQSRGRTEAFHPEARGVRSRNAPSSISRHLGRRPLSTSRSKRKRLFPSRPGRRSRPSFILRRGCLGAQGGSGYPAPKALRGRVRSRHAGQKFRFEKNPVKVRHGWASGCALLAIGERNGHRRLISPASGEYPRCVPKPKAQKAEANP